VVDGASEDEAGLAVAKANAAAVSLLPMLVPAMDALLRNHLIVARRNRNVLETARTSGYDTKELAVGFVDLVGSTTLSLRLSMRELGAALGEFETRAADTITDFGGRLVKLIGDEVMFVVGDPRSAAQIALALTDAFAAHRVLPQVRGGLAFGDVMSRDGDYFGPVVNLAARVVKVAAPGTVAVTGGSSAGPSRIRTGSAVSGRTSSRASTTEWSSSSSVAEPAEQRRAGANGRGLWAVPGVAPPGVWGHPEPVRGLSVMGRVRTADCQIPALLR
jgi:class 3 adenylate cyclase